MNVAGYGIAFYLRRQLLSFGTVPSKAGYVYHPSGA
jgi:hypothetical protein